MQNLQQNADKPHPTAHKSNYSPGSDGIILGMQK
jgi:hypothetical protein